MTPSGLLPADRELAEGSPARLAKPRRGQGQGLQFLGTSASPSFLGAGPGWRWPQAQARPLSPGCQAPLPPRWVVHGRAAQSERRCVSSLDSALHEPRASLWDVTCVSQERVGCSHPQCDVRPLPLGRGCHPEILACPAAWAAGTALAFNCCAQETVSLSV